MKRSTVQLTAMMRSGCVRGGTTGQSQLGWPVQRGHERRRLGVTLLWFWGRSVLAWDLHVDNITVASECKQTDSRWRGVKTGTQVWRPLSSPGCRRKMTQIRDGCWNQGPDLSGCYRNQMGETRKAVPQRTFRFGAMNLKNRGRIRGLQPRWSLRARDTDLFSKGVSETNRWN